MVEVAVQYFVCLYELIGLSLPVLACGCTQGYNSASIFTVESKCGIRQILTPKWHIRMNLPHSGLDPPISRGGTVKLQVRWLKGDGNRGLCWPKAGALEAT